MSTITNPPVIADADIPATIARDTETAAAVAAHEADTTVVHGITDTSTLVLTSDSRLSDARTPTDGSVTDIKVAASAAIAESKLSLASDAVAGTASRRTLGTGATQAAAGNHAHSGAYVAQTLVDAKGDLIVGTADDTVARLAIGTDGYVLTADAASTPGLKWAAASGGATVPGEYGDGSDGVINFDGTTTVLGLAPSSGVYTLTRDIFLAGGSQVSGTAVIKLAAFRIFCNGTFTIATGAVVHFDGVTASGTTGGAVINAGTVLGSPAGTNGSGSSGDSQANALGGNGGTGGGSSGGPGTGGGFGSTLTPPAATSGMPRSLVTTHYIASAATRWAGGARGSSGSAAASSTGGGGGTGGGVVELYVYNLVCNGLIRAKGGNGGDATGAGTGAGGGAGGGGGALVLTYHTKSGTGSTFTAATNCPGGTGGAPQGAGKTGGTASNGNIYEIVH